MFHTKETETAVPEAAWPENGGEWSDGEADAMEESGLLQEMAEEDESIDLYNEETFGAGVLFRDSLLSNV